MAVSRKLNMTRVATLLDTGLSVTEAAGKVGIHPATLYRRLKRIRHTSEQLNPIQAASLRGDGMPEPAYTPAYQTPIARAFDLGEDESDERSPGDMPTTVDEAVQVMKEFIGYSTQPAEPVLPFIRTTGGMKILLINDLHVPFHNMEAIRQVVQEHAEDTDLLIIGGDLLDLFAVSRYEKFKMHFSLAEELRQGQAMLKMLASHFKKIVLMSGNHDERWKKNLVKRGITPAELESMNILGQMATGDDSFTVVDPLYCLARQLANVEVAKPIVVDYAEFGFLYQIGDLVISHAEKFSRVPGQAAVQAAQWFKSYAQDKGIVQPFRVFAQCHTHQAAMVWSNFGIWAMECGCLCRTPDYAANPKLMGAQRDSILGYSVFYQDASGRTDMTVSRFVPIKL
jgi:predicted phosphodiesterase